MSVTILNPPSCPKARTPWLGSCGPVSAKWKAGSRERCLGWHLPMERLASEKRHAVDRGSRQRGLD